MAKLPIEKYHDKMFKELEGTRKIREFKTGATRDTDKGKLDFEGFFSPPVMEAFAKYMHKHRKLSDGTYRDSDNWQKGFGEGRLHFNTCMKSMWRHFFDLWKEHRGIKTKEGILNALMGLLFNVMAYADQYLRRMKKNKKGGEKK